MAVNESNANLLWKQCGSPLAVDNVTPLSDVQPQSATFSSDDHKRVELSQTEKSSGAVDHIGEDDHKMLELSQPEKSGGAIDHIGGCDFGHQSPYIGANCEKNETLLTISHCVLDTNVTRSTASSLECQPNLPSSMAHQNQTTLTKASSSPVLTVRPMITPGSCSSNATALETVQASSNIAPLETAQGHSSSIETPASSANPLSTIVQESKLESTFCTTVMSTGAHAAVSTKAAVFTTAIVCTSTTFEARVHASNSIAPTEKHATEPNSAAALLSSQHPSSAVATHHSGTSNLYSDDQELSQVSTSANPPPFSVAPTLTSTSTIPTSLTSAVPYHASGISAHIAPRRSSSRSIKKPKFDDELVDTSAVKRTSSRRTSECSPQEGKIRKLELMPNPPRSKPELTDDAVPTLFLFQEEPKKRPFSGPLKSASRSKLPSSRQQSSASQPSSKKKVKKVKAAPVPPEFGRWRPTDDLALVTAVQQTCDLQAVHMAVSFSCNFTLKDIQDRWFALLYDPLVSRLAQQAMKNLPSDVVYSIQRNALWSREEEALLADIDNDDHPTVKDFQKLLDEHYTVFHKTRTARTLRNHWLLLRHYQLLSCQTVKPSTIGGLQTTLNDMEAKIVDDQLAGPEDDTLSQELSQNDRINKREIRRLEEEIPKWELLIQASLGEDTPEDFKTNAFDDTTLAYLHGKVVKFPIRKKEVIIGRSTTEFKVDIDLSLEGPSMKVSRRQATITYEDENFFMHNTGRRPFYVGGIPVMTGSKCLLLPDCIIEIHCMKMILVVNPKIMDVLAKLEAPLPSRSDHPQLTPVVGLKREE